MKNKYQFAVSLPEKVGVRIRKEFHRFEQELIKLIDLGRYPKNIRLTVVMVKRQAILLGLKEIGDMGYEEFRRLCDGEKT